MFRYLVLGLLRDGLPRHGYAIRKSYLQRSGLKISTGNFYRELAKLLGEGLVAGARGERVDPRCAPYCITSAGRDAFDAWFAAPLEHSEGDREDSLSSRVLFLRDADPAIVHRALDRWQDDLWLRGKLLERSRDEAQRRPVDPCAPLMLVLNRRLGHLAVDLELLAELKRVFTAEAVADGRDPAGTVTKDVPGARPSAAGRSIGRR